MSEDHLSDIQQLLRIESEAIAQTATRLDREQVRRVVELLANCKGKVVILGVGKSGIIGQKIAATLTSTGTAALYLHPSDALHGSLGIVQPDDVVMVLSNSGETDELAAMLPYLKNRGVSIVAIVGNLNSTLARRAEAADSSAQARVHRRQRTVAWHQVRVGQRIERRGDRLQCVVHIGAVRMQIQEAGHDLACGAPRLDE